MAELEMENFKEIPEFKAILKAVLRNQIQMLVEQLSDQVGEEAVLLTCSVSEGKSSFLGTETGKSFLDDHQLLKSEFLGYCTKRQHSSKSGDMKSSQNLVVITFGTDHSSQNTPVVQQRDATHHPSTPAEQERDATLVHRHSSAKKRPTPYSRQSQSIKASQQTGENQRQNIKPSNLQSQFSSEQQVLLKNFKFDVDATQKQPNEININNSYQTVDSEAIGNEKLSQGSVDSGLCSTSSQMGTSFNLETSQMVPSLSGTSSTDSQPTMLGAIEIKQEATESADDFDTQGQSSAEGSNAADSSQLNSSSTEQSCLDMGEGRTPDGKFKMVLVQKSEKKARRPLTLEQRVYALKLMSEGLSARKTALSMGVGKSQIQEIFKRRDEIMADWQSENVNPERKRRSKRTPNDEINSMCLNWYNEAVANGYQVSGPVLQQKALELAVQLGVSSFKASNGWLESFRKRFNILTSGQKKNKDMSAEPHFDESVYQEGTSSVDLENSYMQNQIERAIIELDMVSEASGIANPAITKGTSNQPHKGPPTNKDHLPTVNIKSEKS